MFVISKFSFIAFFTFFNNLANKTLNNSSRGIEIFFKGETFAFPHNEFAKIPFLVITRI